MLSDNLNIVNKWTIFKPMSGSFKTALIFFLVLISVLTGCSGSSKADKFHEKGQLFYKHRRYVKAIDQFEQALEVQPNRVSTLVLCADAYLKTDKPAMAIQYCEKVLGTHPDQHDARLTLGQAHLLRAAQAEIENVDNLPNVGREDLGKAEAIARDLLEKDAESLEGIALDGRIRIFKEQYVEAEEIFRRVLIRAPENLVARMGLSESMTTQKKYAEFEALAKPWVENEENPHAALVYQYVSSISMQNRFDEAYRILEPYLNPEKDNLQLQHFLLAGNILLRYIDSLSRKPASVDDDSVEKSDKAQNAAKRKELVLQLGNLGSTMKGMYPNVAQSWFLRGVSYELQDNLDEARKHYEKATDIQEHVRQYRLQLAKVLSRLEEFELARQNLKVVLRRYPYDYDTEILMAECLHREDRFRDAIEIYRRLVRDHPDKTVLKRFLGRSLVLSDRPEDVEEGLSMMGVGVSASVDSESALDLINAEVLMRAAKSLRNEGSLGESDPRFAEAEQKFRKVLEGDPGNLAASIRLAELAIRRNDLFTALVHTRHATQISEETKFRILLASLLGKLNQFDSAASVYERLLREDPEKNIYRVYLADLAVQRDMPDTAVKEFQEVLSREPDKMNWHIRYGLLLNRLDRRQDAIDHMLGVLDKFPDNGAPHQLTARMMIQSGQIIKAIDLLNEWVPRLTSRYMEQRSQLMEEEDTGNSRISVRELLLELTLAEMVAGRYEEAEKHIGEALSFSEENHERRETQVFQVVNNLLLEKPEMALRLISRIELDKELTPMVMPVLRSIAHLAEGDRENAVYAVKKDEMLNKITLRLFRRMINKNEDKQLKDAAPDLALQVFLNSRRLYAETVVTIADRILTGMPEEPFVLTRRAEALQKRKRYPEALETYQRLEMAMPELMEATIAIIEVHVIMATIARDDGDAPRMDKELRSAESASRKLLAGDPKSTKALDKLGLILQMVGRKNDANDIYRRSIEIDPNNYTSYNNLAWNLSGKDELEEALSVANKALEIAPRSSRILDTVGWIEYRRGQYERAAELLTQASRQMPNNPEIRFHLSQALNDAKDQAGAIRELEALVLATPDFPMIGEVRSMLRILAADSLALQQIVN